MTVTRTQYILNRADDILSTSAFIFALSTPFALATYGVYGLYHKMANRLYLEPTSKFNDVVNCERGSPVISTKRDFTGKPVSMHITCEIS